MCVGCGRRCVQVKRQMHKILGEQQRRCLEGSCPGSGATYQERHGACPCVRRQVWNAIQIRVQYQAFP